VFLKPAALIHLKKAMIKNIWVVIAAIVAGFNLLMITANTAIASSDLLGSKTEDLKQVDGRERIRVAVTGHPFSFVASDICNEDIDTCFKVWGLGYFNTERDQITASGNLERTVGTVTNAAIRWIARDLISGSDKDVTFIASASKGVVGIMIDEGDRKNTAKVCIYGEFVGITSPDGALCTENVRVSIR